MALVEFEHDVWWPRIEMKSNWIAAVWRCGLLAACSVVPGSAPPPLGLPKPGLRLFGSLMHAAGGHPASPNAATSPILTGPDLEKAMAAAPGVPYPAGTMQPHDSASMLVCSGRPLPACRTTPRTSCQFLLSETRKARRPLASEPIQVRHDPRPGFFDLR